MTLNLVPQFFCYPSLDFQDTVSPDEDLALHADHQAKMPETLKNLVDHNPEITHLLKKCCS
jgi:hypothetical protein